MSGDLRALLDPVRFARERLGFEPDAMQARVLDPGIRRGLLNCTRQWGKSTVTALKAIHRAYTEPGALIVMLGPSERQSAEFLRKATEFARRLGIRPRGDGKNKVSLLLPNGSRLVGLPQKDDTIRGFSAAQMLLVDEAARVDEGVYQGVRPMLAVSGGDLWLMSTPKGKIGFFYQEWAHGGTGWTRIRVPATECSRIPKEFLEEERRSKGSRVFGQEYMCEFGQDDQSLFDGDMVRSLVRRDVRAMQFSNQEERRGW